MAVCLCQCNYAGYKMPHTILTPPQRHASRSIRLNHCARFIFFVFRIPAVKSPDDVVEVPWVEAVKFLWKTATATIHWVDRFAIHTGLTRLLPHAQLRNHSHPSCSPVDHVTCDSDQYYWRR